MQTALLKHPDDLGLTIVLADGTKVFWLDNERNVVRIRRPGAVVEELPVAKRHPTLTQCEVLWELGAEIQADMSAAELREWELAWPVEVEGGAKDARGRAAVSERLGADQACTRLHDARLTG